VRRQSQESGAENGDRFSGYFGDCFIDAGFAYRLLEVTQLSLHTRPVRVV
jgi:hypothetical protein